MRIIHTGRFLNKKVQIVFLFGFLLATMACNRKGTKGENGSDKPFSIGFDKNTVVDWRGSRLIDSDYISYFDGKSFDQTATGTDMKKDAEGWTVVNCWSDSRDLPFRKEVGLSPDGKTVELSVQFTLPAYKNRTDIDLYYTFKIPLKAVLGMNWTAITGRVFRPKTVEGKLTAGSREDFIGEKTRWLAFSGNGKKLVIDFNPEGMQTYSDHGPNYIQGLWDVKKKGDYLECSFGGHSTIYGGTFNSKAVIFEGEHADYAKRHALKKFSYYIDMPVNVAYSFGAPEPGAGFIRAADSVYDEKRGFGWSGSGIILNTLRPSGAIYGSASGDRPAVFKSLINGKGLYMITARIGTGGQPAGPFSLSCSGKKIAGDLSVAPNTVKTITWSQWLEKGFVEFAFEGDWRISTLALQMLQNTLEDYKFRRGFWRVSGLYEPAVTLKSAYYKKPAEYGISVSSTPLPLAVIRDIDKAVIPPEGKTCLPDQGSKKMAWRFNVNLGSLGPDNAGNFDEFSDPELLKRRFDELKKKNINAILLNGNLSRHLFPEHQERMERMIAMIVKEAHRHGIKVIDHIDLTLLWNMGAGFRILTASPGWLQRSVTDDVPGYFYCPVNPEFKQQFFERMVRHIKATNIDGYMIDEETFGGVSFCGCSHCRKQFHEATGLVLPVDENSPILKNRDSKLWRSWLKWRIQVLGDWCVELKERTNEINPDLTFMRYTTHYGFYSDYAPVKFGASLTESARACDFLGTEIMSRNVYAACRSVFSFRKLKNTLREAFGSPVFGLVYPLQSPEVAYFGWCINNMNAQSTWFMNDIPKNANTPDFTTFKDNMNKQVAKPDASIAMLFSTQSRDWSQDENYYLDPFGFGESMTDLHYQYTTLIERSLKPDKLKQYKTVLVPDAMCLSDKQIDVLLRFADQGGHLILTARAGMYDAIGNKRKEWPFARPLGLKDPLPVASFDGGMLYLEKSDSRLNTQLSFIKIVPDSTKKIREFMTIRTPGGQKYPAGISVRCGLGTVSYISGRIGSLNEEDEKTYKQEWTFEWDQKAFEFQRVLYNLLLVRGSTFEPVDIPRKVFVTVYKQREGNRVFTLVHLLNATGSNMQKGQIVPKGVEGEAFPELSKDLKFRIKSSGVKKAFATSPDFPGHVSLPVRPVEDGWQEITVPKQLLKCYSIIWIENRL